MSPDTTRSGAGATAEDLLRRLRKIEGQVRGIERMVEEGRRCEDVLTQVSAATNALRRVGVMVLGCALTDAIHGALREGREPGPAIDELAAALARLG
jgi:DNA-binding FrmR family transcriptional regulator